MRADDRLGWLEASAADPALGVQQSEVETCADEPDPLVRVVDAVTVWGQGGLPGSLVATVYQLPPEGDYAFDAIVDPTGPKVTAAEFTPTDPWIDWSTITPAIATTSNVQVTDSGSGYASVTGRVAIDQPGPLNIWIAAYLRSGGPIAAIDTMECITEGAPRAFQLQLNTETSGPYTIEKVVAYPTTVKGAGDQFKPSC